MLLVFVQVYQDCLLCLISIPLLCHWSDSFFDGLSNAIEANVKESAV